MLLKLDFSIDTPIYLQIRNQIVIGIANGSLKAGEKLPPIRTLASETGINTMTVNKAYQLLKQEGFIITDRRLGAMVNLERSPNATTSLIEHKELRLLISEFYVNGISKEELLDACSAIYDSLTKS